MIENGKTYLTKKPPKASVCIIGSGPAGITLAWYLIKNGVKNVVLLEGSRPSWPTAPNGTVFDSPKYNENVLLYNGKSTGIFECSERDFLTRPYPNMPNPKQGPWERERIYGGTSVHWGGQCRPLDPITFEARPHFPGWPITRADLDMHYQKACCFMKLEGADEYFGPNSDAPQPGYNFTAEYWAPKVGATVPQVDGFFTAIYQFPRAHYVPKKELLQFQARKLDGCHTIGEFPDEQIQVILNASVLTINQSAGSGKSVTVGVMNDDKNNPCCKGTFELEADVIVTACGAVTNAQLLLLSDIGTSSGLLGHYFMGHPFANTGTLVSTHSDWLTEKEQKLLGYHHDKNDNPYYAGFLTPTAEAQRQHEIGACWFDAGGTETVNFYHELIPHKPSQIRLSDTDARDPVFNQLQSVADWTLSPAAEENYNKLVELFSNAVKARSKKGKDHQVYHNKNWDHFKKTFVFNGHHMGTTRMAASPDLGVVDKDLKIFGTDNIYCAGSSVWASTGISNPTFSIVAFSIRLAEHLAKQVKS